MNTAMHELLTMLMRAVLLSGVGYGLLQAQIPGKPLPEHINDSFCNVCQSLQPSGADLVESVNIFLCIERGDAQGLRAALALDPGLMEALNENELDLLYATIEAGQYYCLIALLESGLRAGAPRALSPIHFAIECGQPQMIMGLIRAGFDINARDAQGLTPLMRAVKRRNSACVQALLEQGAIWPSYMTMQEEQMLTEQDHAFLEEFLMPLYVVNDNVLERSVCEFLHQAIRAADIAAVERHLSVNQANPNLHNGRGDTALHLAFYIGNIEIVYLLLQHGADPFIENAQNQTPYAMYLMYGVRDSRIARFMELRQQERWGLPPQIEAFQANFERDLMPEQQGEPLRMGMYSHSL